MQYREGFSPKIMVVGVGHAGLVTINHMINRNIKEIDYMVVSSETFLLKKSKVTNQVDITEGASLGLGMITVECANGLADNHRTKIKERLIGTNVVVIISGMGGFIGTGVSHVVASCAHEIGALTIAIVTLPFKFEGQRRKDRAMAGVLELKNNTDNILVFPIENIVSIIKNYSILDAFKYVDHVLFKVIESVCKLLNVANKEDIEAKDISGVLSKESLVEVKCDKTIIEMDSRFLNYDEIEVAITPTIIEDSRISDDASKCIKRFIEYQASLDCTLGWIPQNDMGLPEYLGKDKDRRRKKLDELSVRPDGKEVCRYLKKLRANLAKANNIPFENEECIYDGPCAGTCEKCDKEAAYLRDKLFEIPENKRIYPKNFLDDWNKILCMER